MPSRRPSAPSAAPGTSPAPQPREALVVKLQIALAVFAPMLLVGLWLQSKGFFTPPGL